MQTLWQDIRFGARMLRKTPGLTLIALLSLALGIGANTALFSIVDSMLLRMLPVKEPERLVLFKSRAPRDFSPGSYSGNSDRDQAGRRVMTSFPYQSFLRMREKRGALSDICAFGNMGFTVSADGAADRAEGQAVTGSYFGVLGVQASLGRTITEEDDRAASPAVAVISYRYWQNRFNGDPKVIGKQVNLNNVAFTIIGVTPPGFEGAGQAGSTQSVTVPLAWEPQLVLERERSRLYGAGQWWMRMMGRLRPGATAEQARAELENVFQQSVVEHRAARQSQSQAQGGKPILNLDAKDYPRLEVVAGGQGEMDTREYYKGPLYFLLGVVALVLLIACANVANLLLARATARQKEIGVRLALGASRWRLIRQLLTESVMIAALGGALGVLFALWIKDGLLNVAGWGGAGMKALEPRLDLRVLGFTLGLSMLTGIVFGLVPAWRATKVDLAPTLKDNARGSSAGWRSLLSRSLVVTQVALSLLLLLGAGLFLRTLINLQRVDPGFNTKNLLLFGVEPGLIGYKDEKLLQLYDQIGDRLSAIPGVQGVTFSRMTLLSQGSSSRGVYLRSALNAPPDAEGRIKASGEGYIHQVRENFLETMGIPLLAGRTLSSLDGPKSPRVAVVNQTFVNKYFPGESPVGKRFTFDQEKPDDVEIVGLAKDAKYTRQRDAVQPTAYLSWRQELRGMGGATFEVRTAGDPGSVTTSIRQAIKELDDNLPLNNIKTQTEQADETLRMERLFARLLTLFGLLAQQLASIGLYGVMAYAVAQRTNEIGIRMALGASRWRVLQMILRQGMTMTIIGIVLGLAGAFVLTRYLESQMNLSRMMFGVKLTDPTTYAAIAAMLILVSLIACLIPARRATKVDPMTALRVE